MLSLRAIRHDGDQVGIVVGPEDVRGLLSRSARKGKNDLKLCVHCEMSVWPEARMEDDTISLSIVSG